MSCAPMVPMKLSEMWSSGRARKCETIGNQKATMTLRMTWQSGVTSLGGLIYFVLVVYVILVCLLTEKKNPYQPRCGQKPPCSR
eukprot:COSAG04_NODE_2428_length_4141_cov_2.330777_4_plen_84_part_00